MKFRTEICVEPWVYRIDYRSKGFLAGSCFSENIFGRLSEGKFNVVSNPFGVQFNPGSIYSMFTRLSDKKLFTGNDLCFDGDQWFSYSCHGSFSGVDKDQVLDNMNSSVARGAEALEKADYVIITFGTAWVYDLAATGKTVSNCHKQPSGLFVRRRMEVAEIVSLYSELMEGVLHDKQVVFTLSPIRHLRNDFAENSLSKAILRVAMGELVEKYDNAFYFPAYEIMNDDLRDYRFYAEDMAHISEQAVDYIWDKFKMWSMSEETLSCLGRIEKVVHAMGHRPNSGSGSARSAFMKNMGSYVAELQKDMPCLDFSEEAEFFDIEKC